MSVLTTIPSIPGGGYRQRRAAELKAQMEAKAKQRAEDEEAAKRHKKEEHGTGPVGEGEYEVGQGECISSIAKNTGHFWEKIWNHPANAALKEARKDPNVLLPGDRVTIPAKTQKYESGETEMRHRFVRRGEPSKLLLRIVDEDGPRGDEPFTLEVDDRTFEGTTDTDGRLECHIPGNAKRGKLTVGEGACRLVFNLELGGIDPITEVAGVQMRLNNLGFACGPVDGKLGPRISSALKSFQGKHGMAMTGALDEATRAKVKEVHGT